jgi:hypothetical protein
MNDSIVDQNEDKTHRSKCKASRTIFGQTKKCWIIFAFIIIISFIFLDINITPHLSVSISPSSYFRAKKKLQKKKWMKKKFAKNFFFLFSANPDVSVLEQFFSFDSLFDGFYIFFRVLQTFVSGEFFLEFSSWHKLPRN